MRDKKEEYKYSIILTGKFKKHLKNLKKIEKRFKIIGKYHLNIGKRRKTSS